MRMSDKQCPVCGWEIDRIAELEQELAELRKAAEAILNDEGDIGGDMEYISCAALSRLYLALQGGEKDEG